VKKNFFFKNPSQSNLVPHNLVLVSIPSMTLTETEQGRGKALEFVGVPNVSRQEMGRAKETRQVKGPPNWHNSQYLAKRRSDLKGTMADGKAFRPVCLEIHNDTVTLANPINMGRGSVGTSEMFKLAKTKNKQTNKQTNMNINMR